MGMLEYDLQDLITKHLPQQVGDLLRKQLALVDDLKTANEALKIHVMNSAETIKKLNSRLSEEDAITNREVTVTRREREVAVRENAMTLNEYKVIAAEQRTEDIRTIASIFGRNPRFVNTQEYSSDRQVLSQDGCTETLRDRSQNATTTEQE